VEDIKKTVYLFADVHNPVDEQTKCSSDSISFTEYLARETKKDKYVDFFLEIPEGYEMPKKYEKCDKDCNYMQKIANFFATKKEKHNHNIRFHHTDFRGYLTNYTVLGEELSRLEELHNQDETTDLNIDTCLSYLNGAQEELQNVIDFLYNDKPLSDGFDKHITNALTKMKSSYKHEIIKESLPKISAWVVDKILNMMKKKIKSIEDVNSGTAEMKLTFITKIFQYFDLIYASLFDHYLLRRLLDKDYITNAVIYTGGLHVCHYVYTLASFFDFEVTHISDVLCENCEPLEHHILKDGKWIVDVPMEEFTKIIAREGSAHEVFGYVIGTYDNLLEKIQCVDMTKFPRGFK